MKARKFCSSTVSNAQQRGLGCRRWIANSTAGESAFYAMIQDVVMKCPKNYLNVG